MSNLPVIRWREFTSAGAVLNGGKLYFYAAGGTTPKATYPTQADATALTSANANPVVADAYGRFGEIWMIPGDMYRVILKDSADATIWDEDNIAGDLASSGGLVAQVYETAENPNHYGATGTGISDESTYVQAAVTAAAASSRGGVVDLMGRTYRCDSAISIPSGVTIRNGSLDLSHGDINARLVMTGTLGSTNLLTGNVSAGAAVLPLTTAFGISVGSYLYLASGNTGSPIEVVRVVDIDTLNITTDVPIQNAYTTAGSAYVKLMSPVSNVALRDLLLVGASSGSASNWMVNGTYVTDVEVSNVRMTNPKNGITFGAAVGCHVERVRSMSDADGLPSEWFAGVIARSVVIEKCHVTGATTGITVDRYCVDFLISDNKLHGCTTGIALSGVDARCVRNNIKASTNGISIGTPTTAAFLAGGTGERSIAIDGNTIDTASTGNATIKLAVDGAVVEGLSITGNQLFGPCGLDADLITSSELFDWNISGNTFDGDDAADQFVDMDAACSGNGLTVIGNVVDGSIDLNINGNTKGIVVCENYITAGSEPAAVRVYESGPGCVVSGNRIACNASATYGVFIQTLTAVMDSGCVTVSGNAIDGSLGASAGTNIGIYVNCLYGGGSSAISDAAVTGNTVNIAGLDRGIVVDFPRYATITGNTIHGIDTAAATNAGILVDTIADTALVSISGNTVYSESIAIKVDGSAGGAPMVTISGNCCVGGNAAQQVILVDGSAGTPFAALSVTGNTIKDGVYGINIANCTKAIHDGNCFVSQSTAITNGTFTTAGDSAS